jgi:hypothetical protein
VTARATLVARTPVALFRPIVVRDKTVASFYDTIRSTLMLRLGPVHAALFAEPERDPGAAETLWYCAASGPVRTLGGLGTAEQAAASDRLAALIADVRALAGTFAADAPPDQAPIISQMLEQTVRIPSLDFVYLVGDQPVLVLWGHEASSGVPALVPGTTSAEAARAAVSASGMIPRLGAPAGSIWLRSAVVAGLVALLIGAVLALRTCSGEESREQAAMPDDTVIQLAVEQQRERDLRAALDRLTHERQDKLLACVAPPAVPAPPPPQQHVEAPVEPPVVGPPPEPIVALPPVPPLPKPNPIRLPLVKPIGPGPLALTAVPPKLVVPPAPSRCPGTRAKWEAPEVVIVVDGSGSMDTPFDRGQTRIEAAKSAVGSVLHTTPSDVDIGLIYFTACNAVRRDRFYSFAERPQLQAIVNELAATATTPLARSIERAGHIISSEVPSTIVVITDGEDTCGGDPCATARALKASHPNVTVNVVDFGAAEGEVVNQCVAQVTGGRLYAPHPGVDLSQMVRQATDQQTTPLGCP